MEVNELLELKHNLEEIYKKILEYMRINKLCNHLALEKKLERNSDEEMCRNLAYFNDYKNKFYEMKNYIISMKKEKNFEVFTEKDVENLISIFTKSNYELECVIHPEEEVSRKN